MSETITVHIDEYDALTYFIVKPSILSEQIEVDPDRLARWHRVFADFNKVQWEILEHIAAALRGEQA